MRLAEVIARLCPPPDWYGSGELEIAAVTADSRQVAPGVLFAALPGSSADGRAFIADAVARGAPAILAPGLRLR